MKKNTIKNLFWGLVLITVLLVASHYDYKYQQEDKQAFDACVIVDSEE